jgi:exportin-2 (importin alpha re-exporter)
LLSNPSTLTIEQHDLLLKTILLLLQLYHDLNSQDLPEFFEDRLPEVMALLLKYLDYRTPAHLIVPSQSSVEEDDDDPPSDLEKIKSQVCEIATLYSLRYLDAFGEGGYLGPFVERTWGLLTGLGNGSKYDSVRSCNPTPAALTLILNNGIACCQRNSLPRCCSQNAISTSVIRSPSYSRKFL